MMKYTIVLFFSILSFVAQAQNLSLQELVNRKQFPEVLARADSLTAADSASYTTMSAISQAYEGMFRYKEAYTCFQYCLSMDTTNVDALNALARGAMYMVDSVEDAMELIDSQTMAKETKLPKLASAVSFVAAGENRKAIITSLDKVKEALAGKTGTLITK